MLAKKKTLSFNSFFMYFFALSLSLLTFFIITQTPFPLHIPFSYEGDALFVQSWIKSIIDNGWYLANPYLGAPNGYNIADFPMADGLHLLAIKLLSYFTSNYAVILNSFYILTYPSITLAALFVLLRLGISYPFALTASLLFAFMPYHFLRGEAHLFLSSYYAVPLFTWLAIQTGSTKMKKWGLYLPLCLLIGSSGVYYAFFGVFFILLSGLMGSITTSRWQLLAQSVLLAGTITATVIVNITPSLINQAHFGKNLETAHRNPYESELFGLKIAPMLLPISGDRAKFLASFRENYDNSTPLKSENMLGSGIIVSMGFLILIATLLFRRNTANEPNNDYLTLMSKLNISGLLLGTLGGFGALFAYTITPMIRCYERISIYLIFFSLFAFFWLVQKNIIRFLPKYQNKVIWLLSITFLSIGIFSQTSASYSYKRTRESIIANFHNDKKFTNQIEAITPPNSMIFQLPYFPFPERGGTIGAMGDYEHFRPYLHSHYLKWSYGAMKGRTVGAWQDTISQLPTSAMLKNLSYANYNGIYINRLGYTDHGTKIEKEISDLTQTKPIVSLDNNLSFFDLHSYTIQLKKIENNNQWNSHTALTQLRLNVSLNGDKGCYPAESSNNATWIWCENNGSLNLVNYAKTPIKAKLSFKITTGYPDYSLLILKGKGFPLEKQMKINDIESTFSEIIDLAPGRHQITFYSSAKKIEAPTDPRQLYLKIKDIYIEPYIKTS